MKGLIKYHVVPVILACGLAYGTLVLLIKYDLLKGINKTETKIISGEVNTEKGLFANLIADEKLELELLASLSNKNGISIFGSSELSVQSNYISFLYLRDSLGIPAIGFGHAFHQNFSIYCELLAMKEQLKDAQLCILLSPGWFETEGTNTEAFLEFVRPNFLKSIVHNPKIGREEKLKIGEYVSGIYSQIDEPGAAIDYFRQFYAYRNVPVLNDYFEKNTTPVSKVEYRLKPNQTRVPTPAKVDWENMKKRAQYHFIASVKSNKIYVNDPYYLEFVKQKDGSIKKGTFAPVELKNNREFRDFQLLIEFLKNSGCKASFVIQPLNPYHFEGLEKFDDLHKAMNNEIEQAGFPCLDLFVNSRSAYEPGTLGDIMHLGDYGWIRINEFLVKTYYEK